MLPSPIAHSVHVPLLSPDGDNRRLREVCADVETLFFSQLLREMRASIPDDGLIPHGEGETLFQEMLDGEYAKVIARSSPTGLAAMLYRQLTASDAPSAGKKVELFSAQG
ncbi:MAG: flagellar rod assembly protein/muramidase FlgJ [bacterium ADurb.Bin429]|nr:MAG: flagellar rod assembly protein/muramidase FlgJ [bacterium ADurb.Bin429]